MRIVPDREMAYPTESRILHLSSHDSSKRDAPRRTILVLQALPFWSRVHWDESEAVWRAAMLREAGRHFGDWAAAPQRALGHRWRYARASDGGELTRPLLLEFNEGARLGVTGECFARGGGVQAAWKLGRMLASLLSGE